MAFNIVELVTAGQEDCAFDQRCKFGHRVEGHAVYCHNDDWHDSPRKCRRSWYTDGEIKDEDCPGFQANPLFTGELEVTPIAAPLCSRCGGKRLVNTDRAKTETCPLCMGSGEEPGPVALTTYEQDTLELGTTHSGRHDTTGHSFVRVAKTEQEQQSIDKLCQMDLAVLRSVTFADAGILVYLLENTAKGEAVMRQNWKAAEQH